MNWKSVRTAIRDTHEFGKECEQCSDSATKAVGICEGARGPWQQWEAGVSVGEERF